jgi:hypothetical protein
VTSRPRYTALTAPLRHAPPEPVTDDRPNSQINNVSAPTTLVRTSTILECGLNKVVEWETQQSLTCLIVAGQSTFRGKWGCIQGNLYRARFSTRYLGSQFHCDHVIGGTPMTCYTPMPESGR